MKRLIMAFLPVFLLFSGSLKGCSCSESPVDLPIKEIGLGMAEAAYRSVDAEIIFEGILLEWEYDSARFQHPYRLTFEVTDVYKGNCIDTLIIYTDHTNGGCGFPSRIESYSIIFAKLDRTGVYVTWRGDCYKGVNQELESERFDRFRRFLISVVYNVDGDYSFVQKRSYWPLKQEWHSMIQHLEYSILEGRLHGPWVLSNRKGEIVESGVYRNGKRVGTWLYRTEEENEAGYGKIARLQSKQF